MTQFISGPTTINGTITGAVISGQTFSGSVTNAGTISAGGITVSNSDLTGSLINAGAGTIVGAVDLISSTISGNIQDYGYISGGVFIDSASKIVATGSGIEITGPTFTGGISNAGTISISSDYPVSQAGIEVDGVATFGGGITNAGMISIKGRSYAYYDRGIDIGGVATFGGGITNTGTISITADYDEYSDYGIYVDDVATFGSGITNTGTISITADYGYSDYGIYVDDVTTFGGGITNAGTISADDGGIFVENPTALSGSIVNSSGGTISSFDGDAVYLDATYATVTGGITNAGMIATDYGVGIYLYAYDGTFAGNIVNLSGGTISSGDYYDAIDVTDVSQFGTASAGGIINSGTITAGDDGIDVEGATSFVGGITNAGAISAGYSGIAIEYGNFTGGISNASGGTISGLYAGIKVFYNDFGSAGAGGIVNSGTIIGQYLGIEVYSDQTFLGGITNAGTVSALRSTAAAIVLEYSSAGSGSLVNSGTLAAREDGIDLYDTDLTGNIINASGGTISAATGIALFDYSTVAGAIDDSGNLVGGIKIDDSSVLNAATGTGNAIAITGSTFTGGLNNAGTISAATGDGVSIAGSTFLGGISNAGTISGGATGDGIFVSGVADFAGGITNTGAITGVIGINLSGQPNVDVVDAGTIDGTGGTAIAFDTDPDTLTLEAGYNIVGAVVGGGSDLLQLGGNGDTTFDLSSVGAGQQFSGFGTLEVVGGTWIATGSGQDWQIDGGTFELDPFSGTVLTSATVSGGTLDVTDGDTAVATSVLAGGEEIVGAGGIASGITVDGRGTLDLLTLASATAVVFTGSGGTLDLYGSGAPLSAYVPTLAISGLTAGDFVDLTAVPYSAGAVATATSNSLDITVGGTTYSVGLTSTSFANDHFWITSDGGSGTLVFIATSETVSHGVTSYTGTSDEGDVITSGGTLIIAPGAVASNTTVGKGGVLIIEAGGTDIGLINSGGTIVGSGGVLSGTPGSPTINEGVVDPSNGYLAYIGDTINLSTIVASATGSGGFGQVLMTGGTAINSGTIEAIATSAATSAIINLSDVVSGPGHILADGNAAIYIDGAQIFGGTLQTSGTNAFIGVVGGAAGSASISGATISKNSQIFDDGTLNISGGAAATGVKFLAEGPNAALTLSGVSFGGSDKLLATDAATLTVSATGGGSNVFSAGTVVEAEYGADATIFGDVVNSGIISALASGGYDDSVDVYAGSAGTVSNAKGALIAAVAVSGYDNLANALVSAGGAVTNSGTMEALAANGDDNDGYFTLDGGTIANAATGVIEALVMSYGTAELTLNAGSGLANSGAIVASAGADSETELQVNLISGGTVSNSKTIEALASGDSRAQLEITDQSGSGSLVNAKSGTIEAVWTGSGSDGYFDVSFGGAITNSGTVGVAATVDASASTNDFYGSSLANAGTISAFAGTRAYIREFEIDITSAVTNSSTIAWTATADSRIDYGYLDAGSLLNTSAIAVTATADSSVDYVRIDITDAVSNTGTILASATTDSYAEMSVEGGTIANSRLIGAIATADSSADQYITAYGYGSVSALVSNTGTIEAVATGDSSAETDVTVSGDGGRIVNGNLMVASAGATSEAGLYVRVDSYDYTSTSIVNSGTIAASAAGGTAYTELGGFYGASVFNSGGTLLATETAGGSAYLDLGEYEAVVSGGTLKSIGANAYIGTIDGGYGVASGVSIANGTQVVGWDGIMELDALASPISANVLIEGAKDGTVLINGAVTNSGTVEALGNFDDEGQAIISGGTAAVANDKLIVASASESSDAYLTISGSVITNAAKGIIEAVATDESYAEVDIVGTATNSGTIEASGAGDSEAEVYINGTLTNVSAGVLSATGNGTIFLDGGTVSGGKLATTGSEGLIAVDGGESGTIDGATIVAGARVYAYDYGTLTLGNGTVISGKGTTTAFVGADGSGDVIVSGSVTNYGTILAGDYGSGTVEITSGATVNNVSRGIVEIGEDGTVIVDSGGSVGAVTFGQNDNGILEIADQVGAPRTFSGSVVGFGGFASEFPDQEIVLDQVSYAPGTFTVSYTGNTQSGTLTVLSAGGTAAEITLDGNYTNAEFTISSGPGGYVAISDPAAAAGSIWPAPTLAGASDPSAPSTGAASAALLGSYMASLFASAEGQIGNQTADPAQTQTVLAHPHSG